jgi:hypothetical protein
MTAAATITVARRSRPPKPDLLPQGRRSPVPPIAARSIDAEAISVPR